MVILHFPCLFIHNHSYGGILIAVMRHSEQNIGSGRILPRRQFVNSNGIFYNIAHAHTNTNISRVHSRRTVLEALRRNHNIGIQVVISEPCGFFRVPHMTGLARQLHHFAGKLPVIRNIFLQLLGADAAQRRYRHIRLAHQSVVGIPACLRLLTVDSRIQLGYNGIGSRRTRSTLRWLSFSKPRRGNSILYIFRFGIDISIQPRYNGIGSRRMRSI